MFFNFSNKKKSQIFLSEKKSLFDEWVKSKNAEGFGFIMDRLPNPDTVLRKTGKGIAVLRALTNHYQVGTCIDSRKAGTKGTKWHLKENNCPLEHFAVYKEIFSGIDIDELIDNILDTPLYGYVPIEIVWKHNGEYIIPERLSAKPQEWFCFNSDGEFFFKSKNGLIPIDTQGYKFLLPRNKADYLNPYGQAILSRCFWNVAFINGGMEFWVKFTEKLGMPYIFGKYDRAMSEKEQNELLTGLENLVQEAVGVIPSDGSVEIMQTGSSTNSEIYKTLIDKCENNISKAILGQTLTTDVNSNGSYAASKTHACVRADIVNSDKALTEKTINKFIKIINKLNFNDRYLPSFEFVEDDLGLVKAERDNKIKTLGFNFSEEYIMENYGYKTGDISSINERTEK